MQVNARRKTNKSHAKQQKEAKRYVITNIKQKQKMKTYRKTHTYLYYKNENKSTVANKTR